MFRVTDERWLSRGAYVIYPAAAALVVGTVPLLAGPESAIYRCYPPKIFDLRLTVCVASGLEDVCYDTFKVRLLES